MLKCLFLRFYILGQTTLLYITWTVASAPTVVSIAAAFLRAGPLDTPVIHHRPLVSTNPPDCWDQKTF